MRSFDERFAMSLKAVLTGILVFLTTSGNTVLAQEKLIAVAKSRDIPAYNEALEGFKEFLNQAKLDYRLMENYTHFEPKRPDLILAVGSKSAEILCKNSTNVPILFMMVLNPEKINAPGHNATGIAMDISPRNVFLELKKIVPQAKRVGVLYNPSESRSKLAQAEKTAKDLGLEIVPAKVALTRDVYSALRALGPEIDALWMIADTTVYTPDSIQDILLYSLQEKIPVIGLAPSYVKAGALFSLSSDYRDMGRQAAGIAYRLLEGTAPDAIEIESPRKTVLSLNLITAERIGIKIPEKTVQEADHVYK